MRSHRHRAIYLAYGAQEVIIIPESRHRGDVGSIFGRRIRDMFGGRGPLLLTTINQEKEKLSDTAKQKLDLLRRVVVAGNQEGFIPISQDQYALFDNQERSKNDHEKRVIYILSREIQYVAINRSVPVKLRRWFLNNKEIISGLGIGDLFMYYIDHKDAIDHFFQSLAPSTIHETDEFRELHPHSQPEYVFGPHYREMSNYLMTLSRDEISYLSKLREEPTEEEYLMLLAQTDLPQENETGG